MNPTTFLEKPETNSTLSSKHCTLSLTPNLHTNTENIMSQNFILLKEKTEIK